MTNIVLILSHSIEEHDQLKLLSGLGYNVFSLGGYIDPAAPHDPKRPALPDARNADTDRLKACVDALGVPDNIGTAAAHIPDEILDWADIVICHHYLERIFGQWDRLREWGGRVIWRTVGQSVEDNERRAAPFVREGLEVVRYSPKERALPGYAGEDAVIRFYKDPDEWGDWNGNVPVVTNVTQGLATRGPWTNPGFYLEATQGLPCRPAGPESERLPGGLGELPFENMKTLLRESRTYVYTGTQPASYTLGLLEALMMGIPVVSIGPRWMQIFPYGSQLFEGADLAILSDNDPAKVKHALTVMLDDQEAAANIGQHQRWRAIKEFGIDKVGADWLAYLGTP